MTASLMWEFRFCSTREASMCRPFPATPRPTSISIRSWLAIKRRVLVSELSGKSNVLLKAKELKIDFAKDGKATQSILEVLKARESEGYHFEGRKRPLNCWSRRL